MCVRMRRGFIRALEHTLRLKELGLLFAGLPCCSFIFLNLATSRRSRETPFGDALKKYVFDSNVHLILNASSRCSLKGIYHLNVDVRIPIRVQKLLIEFAETQLSSISGLQHGF